jgi:hypothetical protein
LPAASTTRRRLDHDAKSRRDAAALSAHARSRALSRPLRTDTGKTSYLRNRPAYRKLGGRVVYSIDDLQAWAERGAVTSTSDPRGMVLPAKRHEAMPTGRYTR